jgi:hypothetical protein
MGSHVRLREEFEMGINDANNFKRSYLKSHHDFHMHEHVWYIGYSDLIDLSKSAANCMMRGYPLDTSLLNELFGMKIIEVREKRHMNIARVHHG